MQPISPRIAEPLLGHARYKKVRLQSPATLLADTLELGQVKT